MGAGERGPYADLTAKPEGTEFFLFRRSWS
jgi:hypothetical protein